MNIGDFYKYAVDYAQRMRFARPQLADCNAAFVTNENDEVYSCISGITIQDGNVVDVPADTSAYAMMKDAGFDIAKNIAVIRLYDDELLQPSEECMEIMLAVNKKNKNCMVCLGPDKEITLSASRNIVEDQVVDLTKAPEIDDDEYEEITEEAPAAEPVEQAAVEPEPEAEPEVQPEAAPMPDFMMGFDFSADEQPEATPEDEAKALEEKKARQRAAQEAIDKKLAEKAAAEAAKGNGGVAIAEDNPFAATSDAVTPVEETLAVFEDVASGKADSFKPKDEIDAKPLISPEELLKQAKRRKKIAKSNFLFRKRM